jgi:hypothetical protein
MCLAPGAPKKPRKTKLSKGVPMKPKKGQCNEFHTNGGYTSTGGFSPFQNYTGTANWFDTTSNTTTATTVSWFR